MVAVETNPTVGPDAGASVGRNEKTSGSVSRVDRGSSAPRPTEGGSAAGHTTIAALCAAHGLDAVQTRVTVVHIDETPS